MLILSHISAFEFWRSEASKNAAPITLNQAKKLEASAPTPKTSIPDIGILKTTLEDKGIHSSPIHAIRPTESFSRKTPGLKLHRLGSALPNTRLFCVQTNVYAVSPEVCFLQLSSVLCLENLVLAGCELCALHRYPTFPSEELPRYAPSTTPKKLKAFLDSNPKTYGVAKARRALRHLVPRCASPAEIVLALFLHLPCHLGGYGLEKPLANRPIRLTGTARRSTGKEEFVADLYWPGAKLDVEYDGRAYHAPEKNRSKDAERSNALRLMGIEVLRVTRNQLFSLEKTNGAAMQISKHLNKRIRAQGDFATRQLLLRTKFIHFLRTGRFDQPDL